MCRGVTGGNRRKAARAGGAEATADETTRALAEAVRALARRGLTAPELIARLSARGFGRPAIEGAIARLREVGSLDEALVADAVLREASRRRRGSRHLAEVLARRGVPAEIAAPAVQASEETDLERARELVASRFPAGIAAEPKPRAGALRFLVARGYPEEVARKALGIDLGGE
jgi:regulatory protein